MYYHCQFHFYVRLVLLEAPLEIIFLNNSNIIDVFSNSDFPTSFFLSID